MASLNYHPMLNKIIQRLNYSQIGSITNITGTKIPTGFYSSLTHPGYYGDTIFEGCGSTDNLWVSVNIIGSSDKLYLHTSLQITNPVKLTNISKNFSGFSSHIKRTLVEVGALSLGENQLVQKIQNDIFPYI